MNVRLGVGSVAVLLLSFSYSHGQQMSQGADKPESSMRTVVSSGDEFKKETLRRIAVEETAVRQLELTHADDVRLGRSYAQLGLWCEDAAEWDRSETAMERAVSLFRRAKEPNGELAVAIAQLGSLHVTMGKLREGEKEEQEALRLREALNDRLQMARSWIDLTALYLAENQFDRAKDYAQKAVAELVVNGKAVPFDRISARYALALALCSLRECPSAIPLLKDAVEEANAKLEAGDFPIGLGNFFLGYAYWKSGDMADAGPHMQQGTADMSAQLGWGHPYYLAALKQYAQYLREDKNMEALNAVELRIRQAQQVVDVHSIQSGKAAFGFVGLR